MRRLLICLAMVGSAQAQILDGNRLHSYLESDNAAERMYGIGYVTGVADAVRGVVFCPPMNITVGQMADITKNFLANTPAIRHLPGDAIVGHVFKAVWPCQEQRGGKQL